MTPDHARLVSANEQRRRADSGRKKPNDPR